MNENLDTLESELGALRPHPVSPKLQRGVAEQLAGSAVVRTRWPWGTALVGGLAAACLAVAIFLAPQRDARREPGRSIAEVPPAARYVIDDSLPTLQVYQRVLARPAEELDALLGKHAALTLPRDTAEPRMRAFSMTDVELHAWTGEL